MKWFKHLTSAYTDIALRQIVEDFGMEGYGLWWITCELIGQQGENFRIKKEKNWKISLKIISKLEEEKINKILEQFAKLDLIKEKELKNGILSIKNMSKYADEYFIKKKRQSPDTIQTSPYKVPLDKIRLDKNIYSEFSFQGKPCIQDKFTKKWKALDNGDWCEVDNRFLKDIIKTKKHV